MIDLKFLRENPELVKENIKKKFQDHKLPLVDEIYDMDIKYYRNKENIGVGATRKRGKSIVDTEWFSFVDQDDYVLEGYFDSFLRMRKKEPDKMMMVFPKKVIEYILRNIKI